MAEPQASTQAACPRCGAVFTCDPAGACWCAALPRQLKVPTTADTRCLCPRCLEKSLKDEAK